MLIHAVYFLAPTAEFQTRKRVLVLSTPFSPRNKIVLIHAVYFLASLKRGPG